MKKVKKSDKVKRSHRHARCYKPPGEYVHQEKCKNLQISDFRRIQKFGCDAKHEEISINFSIRKFIENYRKIDKFMAPLCILEVRGRNRIEIYRNFDKFGTPDPDPDPGDPFQNPICEIKSAIKLVFSRFQSTPGSLGIPLTPGNRFPEKCRFSIDFSIPIGVPKNGLPHRIADEMRASK